jgi:hypothetical protein
VGPSFVPPPAAGKPALVELDATHLLLVYPVGIDPADTGVPNAEAKLQAAVLDLAAPGPVSGADIPVNAAVEGAASALSHGYASAVRVGSSVYVAWWTDAAPGDALGEDVWLQAVGWNGSAIDWSATELPLPRSVAHRAGAQRRPALAASPLAPGGAIVSAWDDLGKGFGGGEGNGDMVVELIPVPVLRTGGS